MIKAASARLYRRRFIVTAGASLLMAGILSTEFGVWKRSEVVAGPFATEAEITGAETGSRMLFVRVARDNPWAPLFGARGDSLGAQRRSSLRFFVNGEEYAEPHAIQDRIRAGETGIFAHWVKSVRFALPNGAENGPSAEVRLLYPLQIRSPWTSAALLIGLGALLFGAQGPRAATPILRIPALVAGGAAALVGLAALGAAPILRVPVLIAAMATMIAGLAAQGFAAVVRIPVLIAIVATAVASLAAAAYAATIAFAWAGGWALPTTAAVIEHPSVARLAQAEPHFAEIALLIAALGAVCGWFARPLKAEVTRAEARLARLLAAMGLPILFFALVFSTSAQWSGLWRQGDLSCCAIAGLVPFSDANGYYADAHDAVKDGDFSYFSSRRPLAQVLRTTIMTAAGFNYATMVLLQCLLLAASAYVAALAAARWRGIWAGIAFAALAYVIARQFATTTLTEPIGFLLALAATPFFVDALRTRSLAHAILGSMMLTAALLARMGSMFTIPALIVWIAMSFGDRFSRKLRNGLVAGLALAAVSVLNQSAARLYGDDMEFVASNFSYTLCGLSVGGYWSDCPRIYKDEIPPNASGTDKELTRFLYRKALANLEARPEVFFRRLADASNSFVDAVPSILLQGYTAVPPLSGLAATLFFAISLLGLVGLATSASRLELTFWLLFWVSAVISAGFVFFDDGRRVMIAVYPLVSLFFVSGLGAGRAPEHPASRPSVVRARTGAFIAAAACGVAFVVPATAHKVLRSPHYLERPAQAGDELHENFVFGGRRVTGVIVVDDDAPRDKRAPTVRLSDFAAMIEQSGVEKYYQPLLTPNPPATPFAFVHSPSLVLGETTLHQYIAPPDLLLRSEVEAWRLETTPYRVDGGAFSYWLAVTSAVPLQANR